MDSRVSEFDVFGVFKKGGVAGGLELLGEREGEFLGEAGVAEFGGSDGHVALAPVVAVGGVELLEDVLVAVFDQNAIIEAIQFIRQVIPHLILLLIL